MQLDNHQLESPTGIRPLDTSTDYFPFFLYVLACLIIAIFLQPVLWGVPVSWGPATLIGLALGVLPVLFILAGAWEPNLPRSIFIASMLMTIGFGLGLFSPVLATLPSDWKPLKIWRSLLQPSTYAFNFPLLILSGALPLMALRSYFGVYLSRHPSRPKPVLSVEHLMLWTTLAACLLYYLRVPMQQLRLTIANVLVFLPGQLCIAAGTTVTLVIPTLRLAFQEKPNRWRWLVIVGATVVSSSLLSLLVNVALSGWLKFGNFSFEQSRVFVCLVTVFYTLGLWTLRASGLRWQHYSPPQDSPETARLAKADRMSGRLWTSAYVAVALITAAVSWHFKEARYSTIASLAALRQEYLKRGEDIAISEAAVLSLRLNSLQPNKLPASFLENGQRLILRNSDIRDDDLVHLSKIQSEFFFHLDLSYTQCTDKAFEHISKLKKLDSLDLSGTRITAQGLTAFLKQNPRISTVILEQMSLDDQQFKQIYNPNVRC